MNLNRISIILVEPGTPANIGMVCRAMANFGVSDLRLVNPCQHLHPEAAKLAVFAKDLLGKARLFDSLAAATADLHLTVAATRRQGQLRGELIESVNLPQLLTPLKADAGVGLVFGREDSGLTTAEVAACSCATTIATVAETGSLNLAQAVLALLYELSRPAPAPVRQQDRPAAQGELDALFAQMESVLDRIAFLNPDRPQTVMNPLRRLLTRAHPQPQEVNLLRGIWSQLEQSISNWPDKRRGGN